MTSVPSRRAGRSKVGLLGTSHAGSRWYHEDSVQRFDSLGGWQDQRFARISASPLTSSIPGSLPDAPVPITSCWHFQAMSSSTDNGVRTKLVLKPLPTLLLAFQDLSTADDHVVLVRCAINLYAAESGATELHVKLAGRSRSTSRALPGSKNEKADHTCSTSWLPQYGHVSLLLPNRPELTFLKRSSCNCDRRIRNEAEVPPD